MSNRGGGVRSSFAAVLVAVAGIVLTSCAPRITLLSDPVFAELYRSADALAHETSQHESWLESLRDFNRSYVLEVVESDVVEPSREEVADTLRNSGAGERIVLSPMLSEHAFYLSRESNNREFIALTSGADRDRADPDGFSRVEHDRRPAFRELGERFAADLENLSDDAELAAFFSTDTPARQAELEAFEAGLGEMRERVDIVTFDEAPNASRIRDELFRVRRPNTRLVAAFVGLHNDVILEEAVAREQKAATEDLGPSGVYGEAVLYSVERAYDTAITRFLGGKRGTLSVNAKLVVRDG